MSEYNTCERELELYQKFKQSHTEICHYQKTKKDNTSNVIAIIIDLVLCFIIADAILGDKAGTGGVMGLGLILGFISAPIVLGIIKHTVAKKVSDIIVSQNPDFLPEQFKNAKKYFDALEKYDKYISTLCRKYPGIETVDYKLNNYINFVVNDVCSQIQKHYYNKNLNWVQKTLNYENVIAKWLEMKNYKVSRHEDKSYDGRWDKIEGTEDICDYSIRSKPSKYYFSITKNKEPVYISYSGGLMTETYKYLEFLAKEMQNNNVKIGWFFLQKEELPPEYIEYATQHNIKIVGNSELATYPKVVEDKDDKIKCHLPSCKVICPIISSNLNDPAYTWQFRTYYVVEKLFENADEASRATDNIKVNNNCAWGIKTYKNNIYVLVHSIFGFLLDPRFTYIKRFSYKEDWIDVKSMFDRKY